MNGHHKAECLPTVVSRRKHPLSSVQTSVQASISDRLLRVCIIRLIFSLPLRLSLPFSSSLSFWWCTLDVLHRYEDRISFAPSRVEKAWSQKPTCNIFLIRSPFFDCCWVCLGLIFVRNELLCEQANAWGRPVISSWCDGWILDPCPSYRLLTNTFS